MPTAPPWDKHQIKMEIARRGQTLASLGALYGLSRASIGITLANRSKAITVADQAIAHFLDVPLHELWPERYDPRGYRLVPLKPLKRLPHGTGTSRKEPAAEAA